MNKMRWSYGDTNPVIAAVMSETEIELGDLLWQAGDNARPASDLTSAEEFKGKFLGVAMQPSAKGCTAPIRVATSGVFEFDCEPRSWELGDRVSAGCSYPNGCLRDQEVFYTTDKDRAIARVARFQHQKFNNSVHIFIRSEVMA